jgi:ubiquinol-cytochrome c reductase cytochrome b subunit
MKRLADRIYRWLDDRLDIERTILPVIKHPVPRGVNWWYVFGSATLIAFTYVPAPVSAYATLEFITDEAFLGSVVRGIHYWGSSAMVVLIVLHTIRVFLWGSYKYPREVSWLSGVVLLLLTLGMAFTGQLLRWNQDAYWAVVVAAAQAARTPVIGDALVTIVVAGQTVGGPTLTRFYATHVFLLPALMFGLLGLHLYLVVKHGISEPPKAGRPVDPATYKQEYEEILEHDGVPFYPQGVWRDAIFASAVGLIVVLLAVVVGPPELGRPADPTDLDAFPRPDWYFLWYFALLALIPAGLENYVIIGAPALAGLVLIALPFVANKGERSMRRRPWAPAIVVVSLVAIGILIGVGREAAWSPELPPPELPVQVRQGVSGDAAAGAQLFEQKACISCHSIRGTGGARGPDLTDVGKRLTGDELTWRILWGGGGMPAYNRALSPEELNALVAFLLALPESRVGDDTPPRPAAGR